MEKIHVAPLSSNSIPALFAVPTGSDNGMRLCKRIIFIKNGMSYSNYVPITQDEANSKNMFGVARVVNLLDEKHKFKRHMVIKNWVNHVKAAKGAITAVQSPIKKPTPSGPASRFVQIPVSTSETVTPNNTPLENSIKNIQSIAPASVLSPLEVPSSKVCKKSNTVSTPKNVSKKDSNHSGKNVTVQTKQQQIVKVLPVKHKEQGGTSDPSDIKITSVFSLAEKGKLYIPKNISQSTVASTQLNALKQIAGHVIQVTRQTKPEQACNVKYQLANSNSAQPVIKVLSSDSVQSKQTSKSSISTTDKSSSKEPNQSILQSSFVTLKQSNIEEKAGTNFEDKLDTDIKEDELIDNERRMSDTKPFNRKSSSVRRSQRRKTATRPYSPSQSSKKSQNSQTIKIERDSNSINNTASIQILKGIKHALDENTLMRRNRVLKISLPKILLTKEHRVKKPRKEFHNQSSSESFEVSEQLMSQTEDVFIKQEPLDASDDNDSTGYLNSFMKEQQLITESYMNDAKSMHFPLVMIKKEPLSDDEDTPDQEPVPLKIIKEEPVSDEDEKSAFTKFQADKQCLNANSHTEGPYQKTSVEQELEALPSREDRVKQLKDRIKEKQNALALFRKRPRISLIDDF